MALYSRMLNNQEDIIKMKDSTILVSVIIPCYNQARFLKDSVGSVLSQTYVNWECIIIDDGSTDDCKIVAENLCKKDRRIRYIYQTNRGLSGARNSGLREAKGDFIQLLDADDVIAQNKFEMQLSCVEGNDVIVSHHTMFTDSIDNTFENVFSRSKYDLTREGILYSFGLKFVFPPHAALIRKSFLDTHKIRFEETVSAREDWLFWCDLILSNAKFIETADILAYYRVHPHSMTRDRKRMANSVVTAALLLYDKFSIEDRAESRNKMAVWVNLVMQRLYEDTASQKKAQSIDYKVGYFLLWPLHRLSSFIKKLVTMFGLKR